MSHILTNNTMEQNDRELRKLQKQRLAAIKKWDYDLLTKLEARIDELMLANNSILDDIISKLRQQ